MTPKLASKPMSKSPNAWIAGWIYAISVCNRSSKGLGNPLVPPATILDKAMIAELSAETDWYPW